jgi:hypothetical protein
MRHHLLLAALLGAALLSAPAVRVAHAGACTTTRCTCNDDCSGSLVCGDQGGTKYCCGPPVTGTPCQKKDGGASAGDGGGGGGGDGGCALGGGAGPGLVGPALAAGLLLAARRVRRRQRGRARG